MTFFFNDTATTEIYTLSLHDALPIFVMGHILHDWGLEEKRLLLEKAYEALPEGGALIVYEALIDDERRENAFGLLASLRSEEHTLNSSHANISYAVFCLKKKNIIHPL